MNTKIITLIIAAIIAAGIIGGIYYTSDYYGANHIGKVPVKYININETDGTTYGITCGTIESPEYVEIHVTGNTTEDTATYYHEAYHVYHWNEGDNDVEAEKYAAEKVNGYVPKINT